MSKQQTIGAPVCTWFPVTDATGRTHMEARWTATRAIAVQAA